MPSRTRTPPGGSRAAPSRRSTTAAHLFPTPDFTADHVTDTRQRLLLAALALFAEKGYAGTTTRALAQAAEVNIAAISYHFGDKQGLYRAAFCEPFGDVQHDVARLLAPAADLREALQRFYAGFIAPLKMGAAAHQAMKLHLREMVEPTGMWQQAIETEIAPMHAGLLTLLARELGVRPDAELQRLAHSLAAMAVYLFVGHDVLATLTPALVRNNAAIDAWSERLADYGVALVQAERKRRQAQAKTTSSRSSS
jgi:TetR/AcrR family transcriptional regulator, regulator of cefoperazone and chloramphenicol sensitivity